MKTEEAREKQGAEPLVVSVRKAQEMLDCCRATVYRLMEGGELRFTKVGSARRIPVEAIHEYLEKGMVGR